MNKKNKIDLSSLSENNKIVEDPRITEEMRVYGWENAKQAADEVYSSLHRCLVDGRLIFAYKGATSNFYQIVVTQDIDEFTRMPKDTFSVGITTYGFSALLPHVPLSYLEEDIPKDLSNYKIDKNIINVYQCIINELKNV